MRDKWQGNRRASVAKDDMSASRWKQLKHTLESKKVVNSFSVFFIFNDFERVSEAYDLLCSMCSSGHTRLYGSSQVFVFICVDNLHFGLS